MKSWHLAFCTVEMYWSQWTKGEPRHACWIFSSKTEFVFEHISSIDNLWCNVVYRIASICHLGSKKGAQISSPVSTLVPSTLPLLVLLNRLSLLLLVLILLLLADACCWSVPVSSFLLQVATLSWRDIWKEGGWTNVWSASLNRIFVIWAIWWFMHWIQQKEYPHVKMLSRQLNKFQQTVLKIYRQIRRFTTDTHSMIFQEQKNHPFCLLKYLSKKAGGLKVLPPAARASSIKHLITWQ